MGDVDEQVYRETAALDAWHMSRALELARRGQGAVEPNPLVGCVIAHGAEIIGEGWHQRFGGAHAEIEALAVAGPRAAGATVYVTLEPCCHQGKTPPCTRALIAAQVRRVVVASADPFPAVAGKGLAELQAAGIETQTDLLSAAAEQLNAPYFKLLRTGKPWVIAKWAMTLDGKIATHTGNSRWISNESSRRVVHALRGRVDAIIVGRGTVAADDPLLTARPAGPRTAVRVVLDRLARTPLDSQLVRTARDVPVVVVVGPKADAGRCSALAEAGCEVLTLPTSEPAAAWELLLDELGNRRMTNVLVEGGAEVLGSLVDARQLDEVHIFVAPKLIGGAGALSPVAGLGHAEIAASLGVGSLELELLDGDLYLHGRVERAQS